MSDSSSSSSEDAPRKYTSIREFIDSISKDRNILAFHISAVPRSGGAVQSYYFPVDSYTEEQLARRREQAFLKKRPISDELASFMGLPPKSMSSQTDVTKFIANYIKENKCQDNVFKRIIIPDGKLTTLLRLGRFDPKLTFINLQGYLKKHFISSRT